MMTLMCFHGSCPLSLVLMRSRPDRILIHKVYITLFATYNTCDIGLGILMCELGLSRPKKGIWLGFEHNLPSTPICMSRDAVCLGHMVLALCCWYMRPLWILAW